MKNKTFTRLLLALTLLLTVLTLCHIHYAVYSYENCSIIYFIAKELW